MSTAARLRERYRSELLPAALALDGLPDVGVLTFEGGHGLGGFSQ